MEGSLPDNYNMLHKMYAEVNNSLGDVELDAKSDEKTSGDEEGEKEQEEKDATKRKKWTLKEVNGK